MQGSPPRPEYVVAWIGLAGALLGVAVANLAEWFRGKSAFRREKAWAVYEQRRARLEQVYELLEEVRSAYSATFTRAEISLIEAGVPSELPEQPKIPWARLRMLVHLYTPELAHHLPQIETAGSRVGFAASVATIHASTNEAENARLRQQLRTAVGELATAIDVARDELIEKSRLLAAESEKMAESKLLMPIQSRPAGRFRALLPFRSRSP